MGCDQVSPQDLLHNVGWRERVSAGNVTKEILSGSAAEAHQAMSCLVVGQQIIVPKNLEHRPSELSLIVVTDLVVPHWLSSPIRS